MVGDCVALPTGAREALPTGDHLTTSSQGKNVNLLLGMGDGNSGRLRSTPYRRSSPRIFSRENREPVIGKKSWDLWVIAPQILLKGKL
jgi:hypothetical protein